jgi:hypothetical protein
LFAAPVNASLDSGHAQLFRKSFRKHCSINGSNIAGLQTASQLLNLFRCPREAAFCLRLFLEHQASPPTQH